MSDVSWIKNRWDYLIRYTDREGRQHDWHARYNERVDRDVRWRTARGWWAFPDVLDETWDEPVFLDSRLADAMDEFLLLIVHGWLRPFGFVDGDTSRPIYAKGEVRRERAFIVGELTGRGVCPSCRWLAKLTATDVIRYHGPHSRPCPGTHCVPLGEPPLTADGAVS